MKFKILILLMIFATTAFSQTKSIDIKGYGEVSITTNNGKHTVNLGELGTFDCSGTVNPLALKVEVTIEQLKEFPGYKIFSNLGLTDVGLELNSKSLTVVANADAAEKLDTLCRILKITSPTVSIEAKISKKSFELEGELAFSKEPIKLIGIDETGTEVKFYSAGLVAAAEIGSVEIGVFTKFLIKPSKYDPDLEVTYEFAYDLITQEISGAGSMETKWVDPFGIDKFVKKNSIVLENGAVAMAVNPVAATITGVGFALERGKFFNLDFGVAVSIAPLDKQIVIEASRTEMTLNDLTSMLRDGFGLKIKDIFPDDFSLKNAEIKFAPTDATIGQIEIDKGFALKGDVKMSAFGEGRLDFHCDLENEFYLLIDIKSDFNDKLLVELDKMKQAGLYLPKLEKALNDFKLEKLYIELLASKTDLIMSGKCHAKFTFNGKKHEIDFEATLDGEEIAKKIIKKLQEILTSEVVVKVAKEATKIAKNAAAVSTKMMKDAKTIGDHSKHSKEHCDTKCVPNRAKELSRHIVDGSFDAVRKFYFKVFPELGQIKGNTPAETRKIRKKLIENDWKKLCNQIDKDWKTVRNDKAYVKYYTAKSSAENGGRLYRAKVDKYKKKEKEYRDKVWERMMKNTSTGKESAKLKGEKIPKGTYYVKSAKAGNSDNGYFDITYNHDKKKWKINGQRLEVWTKGNNDNKKFKFHKNKYLSYYIITPASDYHYALDCKGRKRDKRTPIHLWRLHRGASQQFYFKHIGGGQFLIIPKSNHKMCLALKDNKNANKGNKVHLWTYNKEKPASSKLWYLINVKTEKKFIPKK